MTEPKVLKANNHSFVFSDVGCYHFQTAATYNTAQPGVLPFYTRQRSLVPLRIGSFNIIPRGEMNNFPLELRDLLDEANLPPQSLSTHEGLRWGQGPALYKIEYENGKRIRKWQEHKEIEGWLNSWDYKEYLEKANVDVIHVNYHGTKYYRNRGPRIGGAGRIEKLKHVSCVKFALEWPDNEDNINHIIVGDFEQPWKYGLTSFPIFDKRNPFSYPVSMTYNGKYTFALDVNYARSSFFGTINWITLDNSLPKLLSNYNANASAIKFHIEVPAKYWEDKQKMLEDQCQLKGVEYKDSMLEILKDKIFLKVAETLSGIGNVGKFLTTDSIFDELGQEYVGWKITPIDQKITDFVNAQLDISKRAGLETTQGMNLHPALSNISSDGNLPSGSELLYAYKLYMIKSTEIPEMIVCKPINDAIEVNFPGSGIRLGFYHDTLLTEEATPPANRMRNMGPGGGTPGNNTNN